MIKAHGGTALTIAMVLGGIKLVPPPTSTVCTWVQVWNLGQEFHGICLERTGDL
jgi:hypothetical protein